MAHIIIAGRPSSEDTAECIILAENLQANFPSLKFIKVLKHLAEWDDYAEQICNLFGFEKKTHPLIFYSSGTFIGNKDSFFKMVRANFKLSVLTDDGQLNVEPSIVQTLTQEQIQIANEEYFTRLNGPKLREKVEKKFRDLKMNDDPCHSLNRYNTLDSPYSLDCIGEMLVFSKYSTKYQPRIGEYIDYPQPTETTSVFIEEEHTKTRREHTDTDEDYDYEEDGKKAEAQKRTEIKFSYHKTLDVPCYTFPDKDTYTISCDLGLNYKLIINPFLSFMGETLLYMHDQSGESTESENSLVLKDYGRMPSLRKIKYDPSIVNIVNSHVSLPKDKVSFVESNIYSDNFLSESDLHYTIKAVQDINGMAMLRVLPNKFTDFKHFASSQIRIVKLPIKDIDYADLPLDLKVDQAVRTLKREKIKSTENQTNNGNHSKLDLLLDHEEFTKYFELKEHFCVEPYKSLGIQHRVKNYTWQEFKQSTIERDVRVMLKELNINGTTGYGFILLLTKNYLFMAPLINPYDWDKNKTPLFAEPSFFAGIFNLPQMEAEWPNTTQDEFIKFDLLDVLKKSTN